MSVKDKPDNKIVVSNGKKDVGRNYLLRLKQNKKVLIVSLIVVFLFILVFVILGVYHKANIKNDTSIKVPTGITAGQKAFYLEDHGQYQASEEVWQQQLKGANKQQKITIYFQQAAIAISFKYFSKAQVYANEILRLDSGSPTFYVAEAQIYQAENKKPIAIHYWQLAISKLNPNSSVDQMKKEEYQQSIASLK